MSPVIVPPLPNDLPLVERNAVRLVVQDSDGKILFLRTCDATAPEQGDWWELPGGGIDPGETYLDAGIRELREETGLRIKAERVGPATWRPTATFQYRGNRRLQHEFVVGVELNERGPAITDTEQLDYEREDFFNARWWSVAELKESAARFYPGRVADILPVFLSGQEVEEPFEFWS